jgi:hypothetical protein
MTDFVQRQLAATLGPGSATTLAQFAPSAALWSFRDVYPANILKLADGKHTTGDIPLTITDPRTIPLPKDYDTANKLAVFISSTQTIKVVTVSPSTPTSTLLLRAGLASDQRGFMSFVDRVTSITITNPQPVAAVVSFMVYEYPSDLTDPDNWRDGVETTGVVTT